MTPAAEAGSDAPAHAEAAGLRGPWGQEDLKARVRRAVSAERLPQSLLLHGPPGVGTRSLALWTGAALHCAGDRPPCGTCRSCRLAARLEHPDIHLHFPMPRPKRASSRAKLREAIETQRQERLARLREEPDAILDEDAVTGIYVAAIENIRQQAARRPAMGRRAVFVIAEADRMVPQSASPEAANAFLKLLEEPPDYAYLILTTGRPESLLPTIRSRTASLRVAPLPEDEVAAFLVQRHGASPERALSLARRAEGAVGRAARLWETGDDEAQAAGDRLLTAALQGGARARYRVAGEYTARGARSILQPALEDLRHRLRDLACAACGADEHALDPGVVREMLGDRDIGERAALSALGAVDEALDGVSRNLNPQSTVAVLLGDLQRAFGTVG